MYSNNFLGKKEQSNFNYTIKRKKENNEQKNVTSDFLLCEKIHLEKNCGVTIFIIYTERERERGSEFYL